MVLATVAALHSVDHFSWHLCIVVGCLTLFVKRHDHHGSAMPLHDLGVMPEHASSATQTRHAYRVLCLCQGVQSSWVCTMQEPFGILNMAQLQTSHACQVASARQQHT